MNKIVRVDSNWYDSLVSDIRDLEFQGIVITKHAIGKRILEDELKFGKPEYGRKKIEGLAKDLDIRSRELWQCIQFAKKCDNIAQFKDHSWYHITHNILPEPREKPETPELPKGKFNVIYADPPWKYDFSTTTNREIENQYSTMDLEEIKNIKIPACNNTVLYLWATAPKLIEALEVMKAWGFEYKTNAMWDKEIIGCGWWFRGQHELLLVGVKGQVSPPPQSLRVSSVLRERRTKHSKKPNVVKNWIGNWHKRGQKIELFARENTPGWTAWGNEL